ncbi:MAG: hypothetical protein IKI58_01805 [Oscillospiraceae bacterium]|nr:hypothetical protein [Oscillospiraceae bacterium]
MTERQIDAALAGLARQQPRAPAKSIEAMARTVSLLGAERKQRMGITAEPEKKPSKKLSAGTPVKDKNKSL